MENITNISISNLLPNEHNFYSLTDLEVLADDIERQGLQHNLVVTPCGVDSETPEKYRIISGHRRLKAIEFLVSEGRTEITEIPCTVKYYNNLEDEMLDLIMLNATSRKLTDGEYLTQYEKALEIASSEKLKGKKIGKTREYIAQIIGTSSAKVSRIEKIEREGSEELKNAINSGDISINSAYDIAKLSTPEQQDIVEKTAAEKAKKKASKGKKSSSEKKAPALSDTQKNFKKFLKDWTEKIMNTENFDEFADTLKIQLEKIVNWEDE
jgi:ParB family chromosome partitioning protein